MRNYYSIFGLVLFLSATRTVSAAIDYTFVSVDYSRFSSSIEGYSDVPDGNSVSIDFSYALRPHVVVTLGYNKGSVDARQNGIEFKADFISTSLGVLVHVPVNKSTDLIVAVRFINGDIDVDIQDEFVGTLDANGGETRIGFRGMVRDNIEVNGYMYKITIEDDSNIGAHFGFSWYMTESFTFDAGYNFNNDNDVLSVGLTKYF